MAEFNFAEVTPLPMVAVAAIAINTFVKTETTTVKGVTTSTSAADFLTCGVAVDAQPTIGGMLGVQSYGLAKVKAGAAIAAGAMVTSDATGRAVTAATGNSVFGVNIGGAVAAANEVATILLTPLPNLTGPTTP